MTREENLHWLDAEIRTWESECQSKHPIKEALYAARKALEQEPFIDKPCVSIGVCHEDKIKVLNKIRAEIEEINVGITPLVNVYKILNIIDKYKSESEG